MRWLVMALLVAASSPAGTAQDDEPATEHFTAVAMSAGGVQSNPVAAPLQIDIERWSSAAERKRMVDALGKGQRAMLEVLRDLPRVGSIRTPGQLGLGLHYAHQTRDEDGQRRIFLATDRPIGFAEEWYRARTVDYPFTFVELNVPVEGEGTGRLSLAVSVTASRDGRFVHAEHWDTAPIPLTQVKRRR